MYALRPPSFPEGFDIKHPYWGWVEVSESAWFRFKREFDPASAMTQSDLEEALELCFWRSVPQVYEITITGGLRLFVPRYAEIIYLLDEETMMRFMIRQSDLVLVSSKKMIDPLVPNPQPEENKVSAA